MVVTCIDDFLSTILLLIIWRDWDEVGDCGVRLVSFCTWARKRNETGRGAGYIWHPAQYKEPKKPGKCIQQVLSIQELCLLQNISSEDAAKKMTFLGSEIFA